MENRNILNQLNRVWSHLLPRRKRQIGMLSILMIFTSILDVLSIGAVAPFLMAISSPEKLLANSFVISIIKIFKIQPPKDLAVPLTLLFIVITLLAGFSRILLLWAQTKLSMIIGTDFSVRVYKNTLYQNYSVHLNRNSSEIIAGIQKTNGLASTIIQPIMLILSSSIVFLAVMLTLVGMEPGIALSALLSFGLIYMIAVFLTKRKIAKNSQIIAAHQVKVLKAIQEGLGGIRDVIINHTQGFYTNLYQTALIPLQIANSSNKVMGGSTRYIVEALGTVTIAFFAVVFATSRENTTEIASTIPILGVLAFGAQRLLPILQQIFIAYTTIKGSQSSILEALDLLDQRNSEQEYFKLEAPIPFKEFIMLKNISFRYSDQSSWVLRDLTFKIPKGSRVGFIGVTGSGKSTLLDILMGLLMPSEGQLIIDNKILNKKNTLAWQARISHVPQHIFLADTSIAENIAFGVELDKIDMVQVRVAAQMAQISNSIEELSEGYSTIVGERGIRLSGGQRQRIGIARALYRRSDVIVLDEATSALDNVTEANFIKGLEALGRDFTIITVAHRLTTLLNCDIIVEIADGVIKTKGRYEDMIQ